MLIVCLLFFVSATWESNGLYAQARKKITGMVKDDKGVPASNVTVTVKGTSNGVTTNADGVYSIDVSNPNAVLQISFV
ncbi:MAG: carboxypeptidase-like regulatory domain-containing protein, partial [Chitinophagaceae bacterium]